MPSAPFLPVILGPTAVGKTEISIGVAMKTGAEIVSADSMQVYRGMDIGTCKPAAESLGRVPHHLIDVVGVHEGFSAARYRRLALSAIEDIASRGRLPLLVGGSGLYIRAVVDGIFDGPGADAGVREGLAREVRVHGARHLHERLGRVDPLSAARIDYRNVKRVIRALEVHELTGEPLSERQSQWSARAPSHAAMIGLLRPRRELRQRIEQRVEEMFAAGLLEETKRLMGEGLENAPTAAHAIGYREAARYLRRECSLTAAVEETKKRTWQYSRRQMTWFRGDGRIEWILIESGMDDDEAVGRVVDIIEKRQQATEDG